MENDDLNASYLQLNIYEDKDGHLRSPSHGEVPIGYEPRVPIELCEYEDFRNQSKVDFIFVAQSPDYTPATADELLDVFQEFILPFD